MLQTTWNEVEYRLDICRVTKGAHIELIERVIYPEEMIAERWFPGFTLKTLVDFV
jgi:hypothetical protein